MCFIIFNDFYMTHHNLLGICRQLKIRHFYGTFNFSTQCICMGTGSLSTSFRCFCGNVRPLRRKMVFAVASLRGLGALHNTPASNTVCDSDSIACRHCWALANSLIKLSVHLLYSPSFAGRLILCVSSSRFFTSLLRALFNNVYPRCNQCLW